MSSQEHKKIILRTITEKNIIKTYIAKLDDFYEGVELKELLKKLEDHIGLKINKRKFNGEIECGFEGSIIDNIKNFLLLNTNITENNIDINYEIVIKTEKKDEIIDKINKKITLNSIKEKRTTRTYIVGLKDFMTKDEIDVFGKKLQKILGTNSIINNGECGFNGDFTSDSSKKNIIKKYILENTNIAKELIVF
jgi:hypothetical protein